MNYLIYGTDSFRAWSFIRELSSGNHQVIDANDQIESALLSLSQTSLFGKPQIIVFRNLFKAVNLKIEFLRKSTNPFLIWEETETINKTDLAKLSDLHLETKTFQPMHPADVTRWIEDKAKQLHLTLDYEVIKKLGQKHGADLFTLQNEMEKIDLYIKSDSTRKFSVQDLDLVSDVSAEESVFLLMDALSMRSDKQVRASLDRLFHRHSDPWYLYYLVIKQIRQLYQLKIKYPLKLHPYVHEKLTRNLSKWQLNDLRTAMQKLLDIEFSVKKGESEIKPELINFLLQLSMP